MSKEWKKIPTEEKQDITSHSNVSLTKDLLYIAVWPSWSVWRHDPTPDCLGIPCLQIYQKLPFPLTVVSCHPVPAPLFDISGSLKRPMVPLEIGSRHFCTLRQFCGKHKEHFTTAKSFYVRESLQAMLINSFSPLIRLTRLSLIMLSVECPAQWSLTFIGAFDVILLYK